MLPNQFRVFGGWSCIASGLLLFVAHLINFIGGTDEGTLTGSSFVLAAHVILIFALLGIYVTQAQESKVFGLLGMVLSVVGTTFVSGIVFVEIAGFSGVNTDLVFNAAVTAPIYTVGPLLFVLGLLFVGFSIIQSKKLPIASGIFLILGTLVFALASIIGSEKLLIEVFGAAFTGLGFVLCGFPMIQAENVNNTAGFNM
jgi:hypothetical protein